MVNSQARVESPSSILDSVTDLKSLRMLEYLIKRKYK